MPGQKQDVDVVIPELVSFTYTKELVEMYPNVNIASGEKAKFFCYTKVSLKKSFCGSPLMESSPFTRQCTRLQSIFAPTGFINAKREFDDDGFVDKLYQDWYTSNAALRNLHPAPRATNPKPQTSSHKPEATNLKPQTPSHKPRATNPAPQTPSHKP